MNIRTGGILGCVLIFFVLIASATLAEHPFVFAPDEAAFSNTAHSFVEPEKFGPENFDNTLSRIDTTTTTQYGPSYIAGLMIPIKLFGFSIYTVRYFSVFLGLLTLIIFFFLLKYTTKNNYYSILGVFILALDMVFLHSVQFGRMEIMVILFSVSAYLFYFKTLKNHAPADYLLTGLFLSLGLFTHFIGGISAFAVIFFHVLFTQNRPWTNKKNYYMALIPVFSLLIWFLYINGLADKSAVTVSQSSMLRRLVPTFHSYRVVVSDSFLFIWLNFLIYITALIAALFKKHKTTFDTFWIIAAIATFIVTFWGDSYFYISYIPVCFIPLLFLSRYKKNELQTIIRIVLIVVFFSLSIYQQIAVYDLYQGYSYKSYGDNISKCIPEKNGNVFMQLMSPDPYFYVVQFRPDLKAGYPKYPDPDGKLFMKSLQKSDYFIAPPIYYLIVFSPEYKNAQKNPDRLSLINNQIQSEFGINPEIIQYVSSNQVNACTAKLSDKLGSIVVFKLKR